jgi:hypothetical protein
MIMAAGGSSCERPRESQNVIAVVGEEPLALEDLLEDIPDQIRANLTAVEIREIVLNWINSQVLYQEALKNKLDKRRDMQREFQKLKQELLVNKVIEEMLDSDISVGEDEIQEHYDTNRDSAGSRYGACASFAGRDAAAGLPGAEATDQRRGDASGRQRGSCRLPL